MLRDSLFFALRKAIQCFMCLIWGETCSCLALRERQGNGEGVEKGIGCGWGKDPEVKVPFRLRGRQRTGKH